MVLIALVMVALVGAAALALAAGAVQWNRRELHELADAAAIDASLKITNGCDATRAATVIDEADTFVKGRLGGGGSPSITAGTCLTPYSGTDTFSDGTTITINYPYRARIEQVEVILNRTVSLPLGGALGIPNSAQTERAVAQSPQGSLPAVYAAAGGVGCTGTGQVNVAGTVYSYGAITQTGICAIYAHARITKSAYTDFGSVNVYAAGQTFTNAGGACVPGVDAGSVKNICADGSEESYSTCGVKGAGGTEYLDANDKAVDPCVPATTPVPAIPTMTNVPAEPNSDPYALNTLKANTGLSCPPTSSPLTYSNVYAIKPPLPAIVVGTAINGTPGTTLLTQLLPDANLYYHFQPSCYGYLDLSQLPTKQAVFEPGFYHFNTGGLCMNTGATVLGHDVTMEFVNSSSFSTTNCAAAPAGNCTGACVFGAHPCSALPCPPNPGGDLSTANTWLAAPCYTPPVAPADNASCLGASSWCPQSDSSCQNLLIWASSTSPGQFYLSGSSVLDWMLGTIVWPGTCTYASNGNSTFAGRIACNTVTLVGGAANVSLIGNDAGINLAGAQPELIE
jgi:hypothetical protein